MAYGTTKVDVIQSSTANVPVQFNDGNGTQTGTLCRAWVNFNGTGTVAIRSSFNVSSITDNGTGDWTVNFTNALADANYATTTNFYYATNDNGKYANMVVSSSTTTAVGLYYVNPGVGAYDCSIVNVAVFR